MVFSGVEYHNSIPVGEGYHKPLRLVYPLDRDKQGSLEPEVDGRNVVQAMKDTMVLKGTITSQMIFCILPCQLPGTNETFVSGLYQQSA